MANADRAYDEKIAAQKAAAVKAAADKAAAAAGNLGVGADALYDQKAAAAAVKAAADKAAADRAQVLADNAIIKKEQEILAAASAANLAEIKAAAEKKISELNKVAADKKTLADAAKVEADRLAEIARVNAGKAVDADVVAATSRATAAAKGQIFDEKTKELEQLKAKQAADWAYQQKLIADKAAADKVITDKEAADKAATDKIAADKVTADNLAALEADLAAAKTAAETTTTAAAQAAAQTKLDAANAALEAAKRLAEQKANYDKFTADQVAASTKLLQQQMAASKLAYDTAAQEKADAIKVERTSAYEVLKTEFTKYGLGSLVESVEALILNGTPIAEATLKLRATSQYQLRFAGNTMRLKEGKNLYDESTYLALENDFAKSFAAYGQNSLLGATRESAQAKFAEYIGMDKSPDEIKNRIKLAVDEVKGRPEILKTFNKYFPSLDENDLVSYFLDPKDTLSRLETKVQTAQIGAAASNQGLESSVANSLELAQFGLTEQQAKIGYQKVATDLPGIQKLGDIDNIKINQTTAEGAYLKGLASEQRKIDQAAERERNRYAQSSGMNKVSLTDAKPAGQY